MMRKIEPRDWEAITAAFLRYRAGDEAVARTLFNALLDILRGYYRWRTGSPQDADDLAQAALLKLHFGRQRYDAAKPLKTWVFTIASRTLIDHWRRREPPSEELEEVPAGGLGLDVRLEFNEELTRVLETLKPLDRSIVYLYGAEGLSMAEVAQITGLSEGAVKVRAHRAYVKLREMLA
jgi:RNA polymerase sigma-70 factor (ECF subfamily)